ncbi:glycine cleavage system protein GcvH [Abyssisolibacter fermentans]|uniref:glycine cleavage system protein GcvH n=1 Tax=Abyssisolibacter fermentans TaxID=1766203 RepID=UPI00082B15ED|nr:glycine cleavage system protein GcvH [Abyssisolibacter fermentans]
MNFPENLKYNKEHIWVSLEDGVATIGITDYAQDKLGEILFVELPEVGDEIEKGDELTVVESSKKASSVASPVTGEIIEANEKLDDEPEYVNEDAYDAWIAKVKVNDESELEELLEAADYEQIIK